MVLGRVGLSAFDHGDRPKEINLLTRVDIFFQVGVNMGVHNHGLRAEPVQAKVSAGYKQDIFVFTHHAHNNCILCIMYVYIMYV